MKVLSQLCIVSFVFIFISACSNDGEYDFNPTVASANFNPATGDIPPTNNLLFGADGTLDIPIDQSDSAGAVALKNTLNELDGFSTVNPVTTAFSTPLDPATLQLGSTLHMYEVTATPQGAVTGVVGELNSGQILATATGPNQTTLALVPLQPLKQATTYLVVLTSGLGGPGGAPSEASFAYNTVKGSDPLTGSLAALEPVRQLVNTYEAAAATQGVAGEDIILSWSFTTLDTTTVLSSVAASVANSPPVGALAVTPSGSDTSAFLPGSPGLASVYFGSLAVPYYLEGSEANPGLALSGFWKHAGGGSVSRVAPAPIHNSTQTIPVLMTVPTGVVPEGGFPIVIFQHGITQDRSNLLAIADQLAARGLAAIAIDMPLHGIPDAGNPLRAASEAVLGMAMLPAATERTFTIDAVNNTTGAAGPDGTPDSSGTHFINLSSLLSSRDNVRQAAVDLMILNASLGDIGASVNSGNVGFIGHSLGGIVGTTFLAFNDNVTAATIGMSGGGIARLLDGSVSFGPQIEAGLAANGIIKGTPEYESFLAVAQAATDAGDPINHAATAAGKHNMHFIEVIGGNSSLPDQVIPNNVAAAPLSGSGPLIAQMGLQQVNSSQNNASGLDVVVRFTAGDHSSILSPAAGQGITTEMQTQTASFMLSGGTDLTVTDASDIQAP